MEPPLCPACSARIHPGQTAVAVVVGKRRAGAADLDGASPALMLHATCWEAAEMPAHVWAHVTEFTQRGKGCPRCAKQHWPCPVCGQAPVACGERDGPCAACRSALGPSRAQA